MKCKGDKITDLLKDRPFTIKIMGDNMKDEDIREQIEDELNKYKCEYDNCTLCGDKEICDYLLDLFDSNNGLCQVCISFNSRVSECTGSNLCIVRHLSIKLIEARKTIQTQRESLERFILGERE